MAALRAYNLVMYRETKRNLASNYSPRPCFFDKFRPALNRADAKRLGVTLSKEDWKPPCLVFG